MGWIKAAIENAHDWLDSRIYRFRRRRKSPVLNITADPDDLDDDISADSMRWGSAIVGLSSLLILAVIIRFVGAYNPPESPMFLAAQSGRVALLGMLVSVVKFTVSVSLALFTYEIYEHSRLAKRLGHRHVVLAALVIAAALAFGGAAQ